MKLKSSWVAAIIAGVCVVAVLAFQEVMEQIWLLLPVIAILLVLALWGARKLVVGRASSAASAGVWLLTIGGSTLFVLGVLASFAELVLGKDPDRIYPDWLEWGFPIAALFLALGLLVFGIAAIVGGLPKVPFLLLLLFLPVGLGIDAVTGNLQGEDEGIGFYIGFSMLAVGLFMVGRFLRSRSFDAGPQAPSSATPA